MKTRLRLNWLVVLVIGLTGLLPAARAFYAPATQRWVNRDPIQERGGINLYEFVGNNALSQHDPFGLEPPEMGPFPSEGKPISDALKELKDWWCAHFPDAIFCPPNPDRDPEEPVYGMCPAPNFGRGWGKGPGSTGNRFKHMRNHPTDPTKVIFKHPRTGKDIVKPKPPDWPKPQPPKPNPNPPTEGPP